MNVKSMGWKASQHTVRGMGLRSEKPSWRGGEPKRGWGRGTWSGESRGTKAKRLTKEGEHPLEIGRDSGGRPVEGEVGETTRAVLL